MEVTHSKPLPVVEDFNLKHRKIPTSASKKSKPAVAKKKSAMVISEESPSKLGLLKKSRLLENIVMSPVGRHHRY